MGGCNISDAGLANVSGLTELELLTIENSEGITDNGLKHLSHLHKLLALTCYGTSATPQGFDGLRAALPNCSIDANAP